MALPAESLGWKAGRALDLWHKVGASSLDRKPLSKACRTAILLPARTAHEGEISPRLHPKGCKKGRQNVSAGLRYRLARGLIRPSWTDPLVC
jgi:hypothetical protein